MNNSLQIAAGWVGSSSHAQLRPQTLGGSVPQDEALQEEVEKGVFRDVIGLERTTPIFSLLGCGDVFMGPQTRLPSSSERCRRRCVLNCSGCCEASQFGR